MEVKIEIDTQRMMEIGIDQTESWEWLKKKNLKLETAASISPIQEGGSKIRKITLIRP